MSASQSWFGASAVKQRRTRSSWSGASGSLFPVVLRLAEDGSPRVVPADLPDRPIARLAACLADFVGQEPVAELGIIAMGVEDRVRQVGLVPLGAEAGVGEPPVLRQAGDLEDPARHRDGIPSAASSRTTG